MLNRCYLKPVLSQDNIRTQEELHSLRPIYYVVPCFTRPKIAWNPKRIAAKLERLQIYICG